MSGQENTSKESDPAPSSQPLVVPYRGSRIPTQFIPPLLIVLVAAGLLAYRAQIADFRGLHVPSWKWPKLATTPTPTLKQAPAAAKKALKKNDSKAWDDIQREAERKRAELAELERVKEAADKKAAAQPPRIARGPFHRPLTAREREQMLRAQREFQRQHLEQFAHMQRAMIEQQRAMMAQFKNDFDNFPRGPMMHFPDLPAPGALGPDGQRFTMRWEVRINGQRVDGGEVQQDDPARGARNSRRTPRRDRGRLGM